MACSFHKTLFLLAWMLVFAGCFFGRTADATPLEDVCRISLNLSFCLNDFGANMKEAPLPALGNLAIVDVINNMNMTLTKIDLLLYFSVDPQTRNILTDCKNFYSPAFSSFVASAHYNLDNGHFHELGQLAMNAYRAADQCRSSYDAHSSKSPFDTDMYKLKCLTIILDIIADVYLGKHGGN